ncbi:MAG: mechanosensitive ion channel family protein, partial [Myxococcota bacterium]
MDTDNVQSVLSMVRVGGLLTAAIVLLATYGIAQVTTSTMDRIGSRLAEHRLLLQQVSAFARFGVYFVGIFLAVVSAVELRQETVIALSGTAGVALGFAFKDLASSILAGLTILIDKPFQVGDRIAVGDTYGDVTSIGLRSVRIVTLDDNLVTIPNSRFLNDSVASGNAGQLHMLVQTDFYIGADQDVVLAKQLVEQALTTSRYCSLDQPWSVLVSQLEPREHFALRLRAKAYVLDTKFET